MLFSSLIYIFIVVSNPLFASDTKFIQRDLFDCALETAVLVEPVSGLRFHPAGSIPDKSNVARFEGEQYGAEGDNYYAEAKLTGRTLHLTYLTHSRQSRAASIDRTEVTPILLNQFTDYDSVEVTLTRNGNLDHNGNRNYEIDPDLEELSANLRNLKWDYEKAVWKTRLGQMMRSHGFTKVQILNPPRNAASFNMLQLRFIK
jgi:hypothetical protein